MLVVLTTQSIMNKYIDIHSHILYGIDDGSKTIDESLEIINKLKALGFVKIIITPHYISGTSYNADNNIKNNLLQDIKNQTDIDLYLGNEIFMADNLLELLNNKQISPINNSRYLLIEVPLTGRINGVENYLFTLINHGYKPIIAHPERYQILQEDPSLIDKYIDMGVLFQSNYTSITGRYGLKAQKLVKMYLKKGYISFLGTDIHHGHSHFYDDFPKAIKKISRIIGQDKINELSYINPLKVINNEII